MSWITVFLLIVALLLFAQTLFSIHVKMYAWEYPERLFSSQAPASYLSARLSFSVLLPSRYQGTVIYETIQRVWKANYPSALLEIIVICPTDDSRTIAEAQQARRDLGSDRICVVTYSHLPVNKPRALNVGFQQARNQVIAIFDAGDDTDPNIFAMVNTVMIKEGVGVVQAGVQRVNFKDHWFGIHNCLEDFFWFKSRLHFHAKVGMTPLGESAVFIGRKLIEYVGGWDERCLTEGADIGLRLSILDTPTRVVYDTRHVTRQKPPGSAGSLMKQRTLWQQGLLQMLWKGSWRSLPRFNQRLLALYTLSAPYAQAIITLLWPLLVAEMFFIKAPDIVTMAFLLPLYGLFFQFVLSAVGAFLFAREYRLRFSILNLIGMVITFLPYQLITGISALLAVFREIRKR